MERSTRFIGLDVHKDTIAVAITAAGERGWQGNRLRHNPEHCHGAAGAGDTITPGRRGSTGVSSGAMRFCYEAGPCGNGIHCTLTALGEAAWSSPRP
jgi:transposase